MKPIISATAVALTFVTLIGTAHGHGYMFEPPTRNYDAWLNGMDSGSQEGVPPREYCTHCLNTKGPGSVCGTSENGINYDVWLDSLGDPMPWNSNGRVYGEGATITISSFLVAHHTGHMEVKACPMGSASTQECFDEPGHILEFVEDLAYDMPKDENYPERGYYYGSQEFNNNAFSMQFKLPEGLVGEEVLLQWWYYTANSCTPEGYAEYFGANSDLPEDFWNSSMDICTDEQWTPVFYSGAWPERFVNCAEVTIVQGGGPVETPTASPVTSTPDPTPPPTNPPTKKKSKCKKDSKRKFKLFDGIEDDDTYSAGTKLTCKDVKKEKNVTTKTQLCSTLARVKGKKKKISKICPRACGCEKEEGPTAAPAESPTPPDNGGGCCSNDYKTCASWCSESQSMCESSACTGMIWLDDGTLENDTCEPRWGTCTDTGDAGCCEGLVCKSSSSTDWKQCLAPEDPDPN